MEVVAFFPFILPEALEDLSEICVWYRRRLPELELRFQADFDNALANILQGPRAYAAEEDGLRRVLLGKFPYHVGYLVENDMVVVVGVIHASRHPGIWKTRA